MLKELNIDQIRKIWVLDLVIRSGSLRKAALKAKVSPSAISQTISALEKSAGISLLIRNKGYVVPTPGALTILNIVRPAFEALEKLKDLNQVSVPRMSWLNFGTYESIAIDILPGLVDRLRATLPHLKLGVRVSRTPNLLTMIRKGELCSALVVEMDDMSRFYMREVFEDRLGFFVAKNHPIAQRGWRAAHEFGVGSLAPSKDGLPRYFNRFLKQLEDIRPCVRSDSFETLRAAAAAGSMVSVLPNRVATRNDDLIEIFPRGSKNREDGTHRLLMVGLTNCDVSEVDFLAEESSRLMNHI